MTLKSIAILSFCVNVHRTGCEGVPTGAEEVTVSRRTELEL